MLQLTRQVVATIVGFVHRIERLPGGNHILDTSLCRRLIALSRATSYQGRIGRWTLTPLAPILVGCAILLYFILMVRRLPSGGLTLQTFAPTPLLWPSSDFGSSAPIGTRTGYMSLGAVPFILVFGSKCGTSCL